MKACGFPFPLCADWQTCPVCTERVAEHRKQRSPDTAAAADSAPRGRADGSSPTVSEPRAAASVNAAPILVERDGGGAAFHPNDEWFSEEELD